MNTNNYAGIDDSYAKLDKSKTVLIPVAPNSKDVEKDAHHSFESFLEASKHLELYDIETDSEAYKHGIHIPQMITKSTTADMIALVHDEAKKYIKRNKFVTLFSEDRSVSMGSIRAFNECFDDLTVVQLDAQSNVRPDFKGDPYHPHCALYEASQKTNLVQVGIRSMSSIEKSLINEEKTYFAHEMSQDDFWIDSVIDKMTDNVYITFDLDVLDPSIMPATKQPEPGGLFWYETIEFLKETFKEKNVVGFDITGFHDDGVYKFPNIFAVKFYYKMLTYKYMGD